MTVQSDGTKMYRILHRKIKTLKMVVKSMEKSRSYQGWCAESIQLQVLESIRDEVDG